MCIVAAVDHHRKRLKLFKNIQPGDSYISFDSSNLAEKLINKGETIIISDAMNDRRFCVSSFIDFIIPE